MRVSLVYQDLSSESQINIQPNLVYNPASVIKLPIMAAVFRSIHHGYIDWDESITLRSDHKMKGSGNIRYAKTGTRFRVKDLVERMITKSDIIE